MSNLLSLEVCLPRWTGTALLCAPLCSWCSHALGFNCISSVSCSAVQHMFSYATYSVVLQLIKVEHSPISQTSGRHSPTLFCAMKESWVPPVHLATTFNKLKYASQIICRIICLWLKSLEWRGHVCAQECHWCIWLASPNVG